MKASLYGFLAAAALGLSSASSMAEDQALFKKASWIEQPTPVVEVVALNQDQAQRLLTERRKHQEALARLEAEHERKIEAILASTDR